MSTQTPSKLEFMHLLRQCLLKNEKYEFPPKSKAGNDGSDNYIEYKYYFKSDKGNYESETGIRIFLNNFFTIKNVKKSTSGFELSNLDFKNSEIINQDKFLGIHFVRDRGSHLAPFFLLDQINQNIEYVYFASIATDTTYPYAEIKQISNSQNNYCEVFFPIIFQNQETAEKMELIRDIIFAFFYYHKIKIIIRKAKYIVKDEYLKERDAILTVALSPFIRYPGLANSIPDDKKEDNKKKANKNKVDKKEDNKNLYYYSTKLNPNDINYIETKFENNCSGVKLLFDEEEDHPKESKSQKLNFSTVLVFDSKLRQLKTLGLSNLPFLDISYRRVKISYDLFKTFNNIIKYNQENTKNDLTFSTINISKIVSIVDAGQRDSITDVSTFISTSFFYDSNAGSSSCSYCHTSNGDVLYFTFCTVDRDSILANANAIAASLRISNIIIFPVSFPPYKFIQCFEYAITRFSLLVSDVELKTDKNDIQIYLQFPDSTTKEQAQYFNKVFKKTLNNLGLQKIKCDFFIGYDGEIKNVINSIKDKNDRRTPRRTRNRADTQKSGGNVENIINAFSSFSAVNDYREYMDMNLFFESRQANIVTEYKSIMFNHNNE